jgi:NTE family protein
MDERRKRKKNVALILAGAVAKGAFEAGVLEVLSQRQVQVTRIVAASAGALNGVLYAAAVRAGRETEGARQLVEVWAHHAGLRDVFHARPSQWLPFRGLSDQRNLLELLSQYVRPTEQHVAPINLRIVVTPLAGVPGKIIAQGDATTHEAMREFSERDFATTASLSEVFATAVASASFPGAFTAFDLGDPLGMCIDGGTTNNTPIKHALDGTIGDELDAIIVVVTTPQRTQARAVDDKGVGLVGQVAEILINERLYRDLRTAEEVNRKILELERLGLREPDLERVMTTLGWKRRIQIVSIRPDEALPGSLFSGFWHPDERDEYIRIGRARASEVLADFA